MLWDHVIKGDQGHASSRVIIQGHVHDPRQDQGHVIKDYVIRNP
jgi:hypothetical protein